MINEIKGIFIHSNKLCRESKKYQSCLAFILLFLSKTEQKHKKRRLSKAVSTSVCSLVFWPSTRRASDWMSSHKREKSDHDLQSVSVNTASEKGIQCQGAS